MVLLHHTSTNQHTLLPLPLAGASRIVHSANVVCLRMSWHWPCVGRRLRRHKQTQAALGNADGQLGRRRKKLYPACCNYDHSSQLRNSLVRESCKRSIDLGNRRSHLAVEQVSAHSASGERQAKDIYSFRVMRDWRAPCTTPLGMACSITGLRQSSLVQSLRASRASYSHSRENLGNTSMSDERKDSSEIGASRRPSHPDHLALRRAAKSR